MIIPVPVNNFVFLLAGGFCGKILSDHLERFLIGFRTAVRDIDFRQRRQQRGELGGQLDIRRGGH
ncbi:hypothetical protein D3C72_2521010 [compost metagenome]